MFMEEFANEVRKLAIARGADAYLGFSGMYTWLSGQFDQMDRKVKDAENDRRLVLALNELRWQEGASVSIHCDNPDFNGLSNSAIEVSDDWTGWQPLRFVGDNVLEALESAVSEKTKRKKRG